MNCCDFLSNNLCIIQGNESAVPHSKYAAILAKRFPPSTVPIIKISQLRMLMFTKRFSVLDELENNLLRKINVRTGEIP